MFLELLRQKVIGLLAKSPVLSMVLLGSLAVGVFAATRDPSRTPASAAQSAPPLIESCAEILPKIYLHDYEPDLTSLQRTALKQQAINNFFERRFEWSLFFVDAFMNLDGGATATFRCWSESGPWKINGTIRLVFSKATVQVAAGLKKETVYKIAGSLKKYGFESDGPVFTGEAEDVLP